jgi:hypothetical protein
MKVWYCNDPKNKPSLQDAQRFVDGYVEVLQIGDDTQLIINEEGMYRNDLTVNVQATRMAIAANYAVPPQGIVGNVIILEGEACWD